MTTREECLNGEPALTEEEIREQLKGEPEAVVVTALCFLGSISQKSIDEAKSFWKTPEGYEARMKLIYAYNGECLPGELSNEVNEQTNLQG